MREVTEHRVDACNERIRVWADPDNRGDNHAYIAEWDNGATGGVARIDFQVGAVGLGLGVNGITNEVLLAIVSDRLKQFQQGPAYCQENDRVIDSIQTAMFWLAERSNRVASEKTAA